MVREKLYILGKRDHEISRSRQAQEMVSFKNWKQTNKNSKQK